MKKLKNFSKTYSKASRIVQKKAYKLGKSSLDLQWNKNLLSDKIWTMKNWAGRRVQLCNKSLLSNEKKYNRRTINCNNTLDISIVYNALEVIWNYNMLMCSHRQTREWNIGLGTWDFVPAPLPGHFCLLDIINAGGSTISCHVVP